MIEAYPLLLDGVEFRSHSIVGIYEFHDKIAYIHFAFALSSEEYEIDKRTPSYAMLDMFSMDFKEHKQTHLFYNQEETFSHYDAVCYWEDNGFYLNTMGFAGYGPSIAKIMEISDAGLFEIGEAPEPVVNKSNASKTYAFGDKIVHMASDFIMECRYDKSGDLVWKLRLTAYLYTEIEERNGILYFGTAGKGGRFYGVALIDGNVLLCYDTGGTVCYAWHENNIILANRKNKPVLLNAQNGSLERQIDFGKFKFTEDQYMIVKDGRLYAVANGKGGMYAVCVDL